MERLQSSTFMEVWIYYCSDLVFFRDSPYNQRVHRPTMNHLKVGQKGPTQRAIQSQHLLRQRWRVYISHLYFDIYLVTTDCNGQTPNRSTFRVLLWYDSCCECSQRWANSNCTNGNCKVGPISLLQLSEELGFRSRILTTNHLRWWVKK